ncbi:MAG: hypothetical protein JWO12_622 [Frankiales bacterium]|nr:hypothetical protein [Frankiales bacterium]
MKDHQAIRAASRTCVACGTKLSAYNDRPTCYTHTLGVPWKGPSTRPK